MQALVFKGPLSMAIEERSEPDVGSGEVLISVIATGICGSDLHGFTGENGRRFPGQVMGHELVGRILSSGSGVDAQLLPVGTLVTINPVLGCNECDICRGDSDELCPNRRVIGVDPAISSGFAERIVVPQENVVLLPADLPPEIGALVEPLAVGYRAARRGGVSEGDAVLVLGGGPIGQAAALGARRLGARVVVSEIASERAQLVASLGFPALDPSAPDFADRVILKLGHRPDVVIDAVGAIPTMSDALRVSRPGATIVLVGMGAPDLTVEAYRISTEERSIVGSFCYSGREFADTAHWAAERPQELLPLVEEIVSLKEAPDAFARLASGDSRASKILVLFPGDV